MRTYTITFSAYGGDNDGSIGGAGGVVITAH